MAPTESMRLCSFILIGAALLSACGGEGSRPGDAQDASAPAADAQSPTWENFSQQFFADYCQECHGPGDELRDYSQLSMVRAESDVIRGGVDSGQFPIGDGPKPSRDERDRLILWIDIGAPE